MKTNEIYNKTLYSAIRSNFAIERPWLGCHSEIEESVDAAKATYFGIIRDRKGTFALLEEAEKLGIEKGLLTKFLGTYEHLSRFKQPLTKGCSNKSVDRYKIKVQLIENYFKHAGIEF